jgi:hypothetical protein
MHFLDLCRHPQYINERFQISTKVSHSKYSNFAEIHDWCDKHFGPQNEGWILKGPNVYGFKTEQDKLLFALRWA